MSLVPDSPLVGSCVEAINHEPRRGGRHPDLLLLHYTGMPSATRAIEWLRRPESRVSCHYVIDEHGLVTQMVEEALRAWHAGISHWAGESDINSCSIGVEIHNPGHFVDYWDYPPAQMRALEGLCRDIITRHRIAPERVLGHSDVAPQRKDDPGEQLDWARLARAGVGMWVEPAPVVGGAALGPGAQGPIVVDLQARLRRFGYGIVQTGVYDEATRRVVLAFQRHWRPMLCDGRADPSTLATLARLEARKAGA